MRFAGERGIDENPYKHFLNAADIYLNGAMFMPHNEKPEVCHDYRDDGYEQFRN